MFGKCLGIKLAGLRGYSFEHASWVNILLDGTQRIQALSDKKPATVKSDLDTPTYGNRLLSRVTRAPHKQELFMALKGSN